MRNLESSPEAESMCFVADNGFESGDGLQCSPDGLVSSMFPSNIVVWRLKSKDSGVYSFGRDVLEHVCTIPISEYQSQESQEGQNIPDLLGVIDKNRFDACSWSPLGCSANGQSILAVAVHSNKCIHVKVYEYTKTLISVEFVETFSLIEQLRDEWLLIPCFSSSFGRRMLAEEFPSLSMCFEGYCPRCYVKWVSLTINDTGILLVAWGCLIFVWAVGKDSIKPLSAVVVPGADFGSNPIDSLLVSNISYDIPGTCGFRIVTTCVRSPIKRYSDVTLDDEGRYVRNVELSASPSQTDDIGFEVRKLLDGQLLSLSSNILSSTHSWDGKHVYYAKRGVRSSIVIVRDPARV